ncbi:MAG: hypothetical protein EKK40_11700 [Bradyrhizobiaceae bacterium]|nr:MAG: hypothetical protein EKK40_11700 [Bradyrhizobiaceae bacterium]
MPKYRFNLEDHIVIADRGAHECEDVMHAREVADEIAERLVQTQPHLVSADQGIVVRDENNNEVYRAGLDRDSVRQRRGRPG